MTKALYFVGANWHLGVVAIVLMAGSMLLRAISWQVVLRQTFAEKIRFRHVFNAIAVGVFISATSPLRLGEAARALTLSRQLKEPTRQLPAITGTVLSQTIMNLLALTILGAALVAGAFLNIKKATAIGLLILGFIILAAVIIRIGLRHSRHPIVRQIMQNFAGGFYIFRSPRQASIATFFQLLAWLAQVFACLVLLVALHVPARPSLAAAAACLFAVNATAAIPITPSNIGAFQAACIAVLGGVYRVPFGKALAYGILLQTVEVVTAVGLGAWALATEGLSRRQLLQQARGSKATDSTGRA